MPVTSRSNCRTSRRTAGLSVSDESTAASAMGVASPACARAVSAGVLSLCGGAASGAASDGIASSVGDMAQGSRDRLDISTWERCAASRMSALHDNRFHSPPWQRSCISRFLIGRRRREALDGRRGGGTRSGGRRAGAYTHTIRSQRKGGGEAPSFLPRRNGRIAKPRMQFSDTTARPPPAWTRVTSNYFGENYGMMLKEIKRAARSTVRRLPGEGRALTNAYKQLVVLRRVAATKLGAYGATSGIDPARVYALDPARIVLATNGATGQRAFDPRAERGKVYGGHWDRGTQRFDDLPLAKAIRQRVGAEADWSKTDYYTGALAGAETEGLRSRAQLDEHCERLDRLIAAARRGALSTDGSAVSGVDERYPFEIG